MGHKAAVCRRWREACTGPRPETHGHFEGDGLLEPLRGDLKQLSHGLDLPGAHHRGHLLCVCLCERPTGLCFELNK